MRTTKKRNSSVGCTTLRNLKSPPSKQHPLFGLATIAAALDDFFSGLTRHQPEPRRWGQRDSVILSPDCCSSMPPSNPHRPPNPIASVARVPPTSLLSSTHWCPPAKLTTTLFPGAGPDPARQWRRRVRRRIGFLDSRQTRHDTNELHHHRTQTLRSDAFHPRRHRFQSRKSKRHAFCAAVKVDDSNADSSEIEGSQPIATLAFSPSPSLTRVG